MKHCPRCKSMKELNQFSKNKNRKDGLEWQCKDCVKENYNLKKDQIKEKYKIYYLNNKDKISLSQKKYRESNIKSILFRNRLRKLKLKNKIKTIDINNLLIKYNHCCCYCGISIKNNLHIDHKIPLSRGGQHSIDNLVPSCKKCNLSKGSKLIEEWKKNDN